MQTLTWDDIEPAARDAFDIWTSGSDFEWAKEAWGLLTKAGLSNYDTERERHVVIARFLALASLYRDWCSLAFDETQEDSPGYWVEGLEVNPIYVGQLVSDEELSDDPSQSIWDAWQLLLSDQRPVVAAALRAGYGGTDAELFVALWRSVRGFLKPEPGDEDYEEDDEVEILNDATWEKVAAYAWITEGCPKTRP